MRPQLPPRRPAARGVRGLRAFARLLARGALVVGALVGLTGVTVLIAPGTASAGIASDQATIKSLQQRIAAEGARVQSLVARYDAIEGDLQHLRAEIAADGLQLVADRRAQAKATVELRAAALSAYVDALAGNPPPLALLTSAPSASAVPEQGAYLDVASGSLHAALEAWRLDAYRTSADEHALSGAERRARAELGRVAEARQAAQAAIASDEAMLSQVRGNLQSLLAAAAAAQQAAERAREAALAAAEPPPPPPPPPPPVPPPPVAPVSPTGYANPLRAIGGLVPERIDQGVDYSGFGPIYAIGDGVVLNTVNAGWPGGTFIAYQLSNGPAAGLVVYAAEDIEPLVSVGQTVTPNTVIGQMYEGPDGIETGWADPSALGATMAYEYGQFYGWNSTAFGYNFSQLLQSLGAPGGILQNDPPTGSLPPGWPQW